MNIRSHVPDGPGPRPVASLGLPRRPATRASGLGFRGTAEVSGVTCAGPTGSSSTQFTELSPIEWTGKSFNYAAI